jgi:putative endonuclease
MGRVPRWRCGGEYEEDSVRSKGRDYERVAEQYLQQHGVAVVTRNFLCKLGEIDLIGFDDETLVFIEVRYRGQTSHGSALESISFRKQQKILRTASLYLQLNKLWHLNTRFDVIAIGPGADGRPEIEWIRSAFTA